MPEAFVGEIRTFPFGVTPKGWAPCQGQLLPINQFQSLFALLGTTYGGDGRVSFALPDLRGRVAVGVGAAPGGSDFALGEQGGAEAHRLTPAELPRHKHRAQANDTPGVADTPAGAVWAASRRRYARGATTQMSADAVGAAGEDQPHNTMQPFLALNACIALVGVFPSAS